MKSKNLKLAIAVISIASFVTIPTVQSLANGNNTVVAQAAQPSINIKVLSQQDEFVTVEVLLEQPNDQNSRLIINDDKGNIMYEENVSTKKFSRKVKIASSEIPKIEIVFSTPKSDVRKIYAVNISTISKVSIAEEVKN